MKVEDGGRKKMQSVTWKAIATVPLVFLDKKRYYLLKSNTLNIKYMHLFNFNIKKG
jgi:hypothetical protein